MRQIFLNGTVYASVSNVGVAGIQYEKLVRGAVFVEDGQIKAIIPEAALDESLALRHTATDCEIIDLAGQHLVPGFVDVHVHGGGGYDVMAGDVSHIHGMSRFHAAHGTTSILPTTLTADRASIERAIISITEAIEQGTEGAEVIGIHLEGPFISPKRCGAQHPDHIRKASKEELADYIRLANNHVRLITIAPEESPTVEVIQYARQNGMTVSIGHSDATFDEVRTAVGNGATHITHLFNGMRPLHHREPGVAGAALMIDDLSTELICDGHHIHPDLVNFVFRVKPDDKIVLITDAMVAAGLPDGPDYELGGLPCYKQDGQVRLQSNDSLAGSCLTMDQALRNVMQFTGLTLTEVLPSLTINPARQVGCSDKKGSIEAGKDADFVVLNDSWHVTATYVKGVPVYSV